MTKQQEILRLQSLIDSLGKTAARIEVMKQACDQECHSIRERMSQEVDRTVKSTIDQCASIRERTRRQLTEALGSL